MNFEMDPAHIYSNSCRKETRKHQREIAQQPKKKKYTKEGAGEQRG